MKLSVLTDKIKTRLITIYGYQPFSVEQLNMLAGEIKAIKNHISPEAVKWSESTVFLITYGDSIFNSREKPLNTLYHFLNEYLAEIISHVHILPFFPYSSDDGFSIIDYRAVDKKLGDWDDIQKIGSHYRLMFDLVLNHISQHSEWFQSFIRQDGTGKDFFIETDPDTDLSDVTRPRSLPLITPFETAGGLKHLWTTFSADQIDLNYKNPQVLFEMLMIYLYYLRQGSSAVRLDAVAFLWKEIGTSCMHLPQTHEVVKLMKDIAVFLNPGTIIITETNVPEKENLSYFAEGDEADMIYQFSLPPVLLHALYCGNSSYLQKWAGNQPEPPAGCTYYNFTASHDGIGVRPLEGILPFDEILDFAHAIEKMGGIVSSRTTKSGSQNPYELNITYIDALRNTIRGPDEYQMERFISSQTLMMSFRGIPAFYIHSLLGTGNDYEGVRKTGRARSINRYKWDSDDLNEKLRSETIHSYVFSELTRRILIRKKEYSFNPDVPQRVFPTDNNIFIMDRGDILVVANFTSNDVMVNCTQFKKKVTLTEILENRTTHSGMVKLKPYQVGWLK